MAKPAASGDPDMKPHYTEADLLETYYMKPGESMPVMMHLANCPECAARYDRLDRKMREAAACHTEMPESFWGRQKTAILHTAMAVRPRRSTYLAAAAAIVFALFLGAFAIVTVDEKPVAPAAETVTMPSDPWESEPLQDFSAVVAWETWDAEPAASEGKS